MSVRVVCVMLCLGLGVPLRADGIFVVERFEGEPVRLVIHRDPFHLPAEKTADRGREPGPSPAVRGEETKETPEGEPARDSQGVMSRMVSYEGYTRKGGNYYFLIRVDGEFFIGEPGITIAGNIRIIRGDDRQINLEIEGEEVKIKIRDQVQ